MTLPSGDLFFDTLSRATNSFSLSPWRQQLGSWAITNGALTGSSVSNAYGFAYYNDSTWMDYTVQGNVQFSTTNAWGGGIGGRLNPTTGSHYAAWIYPDGSLGGSKVLKLIKFEGWALWSFTPMATANLPAVGTNAHTLKLTFQSKKITVSYDGFPAISLLDTNYDSVPPFASGGIVADLFNAGTPYTMSVNNVSVAPLTAPVILNLTLTNNSAAVTWSSVTGQSYRLQYEDTIGATNWNNVTPDVLATGTNASATNTPVGPNARFYRVLLVP